MDTYRYYQVSEFFARAHVTGMWDYDTQSLVINSADGQDAYPGEVGYVAEDGGLIVDDEGAVLYPYDVLTF